MANELIEINEKSNRLSDVLEIIKAKFNRNYTLNDKSPYSLRINKQLVLRTIQKDFRYLDKVNSDLLVQELEQDKLPEGIIKEAFNRGYIFSDNTNDILKSSKAKNAILEYLNMQEDKKNNDDIFKKSNYKVDYLMEQLSEDALEEEIVNIARRKGYSINSRSKQHFKNIPELALDYYKNISIEDIDRESILNVSLIGNKRFFTRVF